MPETIDTPVINAQIVSEIEEALFHANTVGNQQLARAIGAELQGVTACVVADIDVNGIGYNTQPKTDQYIVFSMAESP